MSPHGSSAGRTSLRGHVRSFWRDAAEADRHSFYGLTAVLLGMAVAIILWPVQVPVATLTVPLIMASLMLKPGQLPWFVGLTMFVLVPIVITQADTDLRNLYRILIVLGVALFILWVSTRRQDLGITGRRAELMLAELRERIQRQGGVPQLPEDWEMQQALRSAAGSPFAGDFVVATRRGGKDHLEFCLVDVSGKGNAAGVRALHLSGALSGILGSMEPASFLPAANEWVLAQDWGEGFATAVHVSLDLATGELEVRSAGHPPAVVRSEGSGRWSVVPAEGPALGFLEDVEYEAVTAQLHHGDLLMIFTDGLVETPTREVHLGIDRLTGLAESVLRGDYTNGAERLMKATGAHGDDRALVMLRRL